MGRVIRPTVWRRLVVAAVVVSIVAVWFVPAGAMDATGVPKGTGTRASFQEIVKADVADIQAYWSETLPAVYGVEYKPIPAKQIRAYDKHSPASAFSKCGGDPPSYKENKGNASYCLLDDTVTYDTGELFPGLKRAFGDFAIALVMAHEWGHAIQGRTLTPDQFVSGSTVLKETQADCFAGAWLGWVKAGNGKHVKFGESELDTGLAGLSSLRDPLGEDPNSDQAHGNAFDRTSAFQLGVEGGAARCKAWDTDPPVITQIPFANPQEATSGANRPFGEVVPAVRTDLDAYGAQLVPGYQPIKDVKAYDGSNPSSVPKCGGETLKADEYKGNSLYCAADDFIAYDKKLARSLYDNIGDFALAWLISGNWAVAVQNRIGAQGSDLGVSMRADCLSGAWAGNLATGGRGPLQLSPGDLDKVVEAVLAFSESAGTAATNRASGTAFQRLQAFRTGFFSKNPVADCVALGA
jgi:predicted metalloprotease